MHGTFAHRINSTRRSIDEVLAAEPHVVLPGRLKIALTLEILLVYAATSVRMRRQNVHEITARGPDGLGRVADVTSTSPAPEDSTRVARRLGWAVTRTLAVLPTDSRCLVQSLVLQRLLAARSIPNRVVIAARADGPFMAHAWVECNSIAVLPSRGYENSRLVEL